MKEGKKCRGDIDRGRQRQGSSNQIAEPIDQNTESGVEREKEKGGKARKQSTNEQETCYCRPKKKDWTGVGGVPIWHSGVSPIRIEFPATKSSRLLVSSLSHLVGGPFTSWPTDSSWPLDLHLPSSISSFDPSLHLSICDHAKQWTLTRSSSPAPFNSYSIR